MADAAGIDWEDAFLNSVYIPDGASYPGRWQARAAEFRANAKAQLDIPYGPHERERFDLFMPEGRPKGLAVIIHGGFWLAFDKSVWSDLATGALAQGWAVAFPGYTLAPEARIGAIARQVGRAIVAAAGLVAGPIRLCGHSAGGQVATRLVCGDTPLPGEVASRIAHVVTLSGLHDLRPLQFHSMNKGLRLDAEEAAAESPALLDPLPGVPVTAWVGAAERPEFLRQSALLAEAWGRKGQQIQLIAEAGRNHFDVLDGLKDPDHPLMRAFLGG
ncbi:alpha/beta hydrolase [Paracoccus xiamenensis]|uniref:alpha/beta hydrolase n=1 Tax=Paracoccus xiamenensis TaxID=2714901 RepID=UPI00140E5AF0|nr:alpha/beta hydrolase [Paracoccus xiamenensis]NHF73255.1 alpha/beta hydrolase [Paracoccus xiamenensis]